jgi:DNA-binding beta-propeller fold protein YncE
MPVDRNWMIGSVQRCFLIVMVSMGLAALSTVAPAAPAKSGHDASFCVLSVEEDGGRLTVLDPGGTARARIALGLRPHEVAVSPDRRTAYVTMFGIADYDDRIGTPGSTIAKIDLTAGRRVAEYQVPADIRGPHGVKLRPPAFAELFVNTEVGGDAMLVLDAASGKLLRRFPLPAGTHNFVFARNGAALFSFAGASGVSKLDPSSGKVLAHADLGSPVRGTFVAKDGNVLASAKGEVVVLAAKDLAVIRRLKSPRVGQFGYLDEWPDGTIVAPSFSDGGVVVFRNGRVPGTFVETGKVPIQVQRGPDNRIYVSNVEDHHLSVIDPNTLSVGMMSDLHGPNGIGFGACPG